MPPKIWQTSGAMGKHDHKTLKKNISEHNHKGNGLLNELHDCSVIILILSS